MIKLKDKKRSHGEVIFLLSSSYGRVVRAHGSTLYLLRVFLKYYIGKSQLFFEV